MNFSEFKLLVLLFEMVLKGTLIIGPDKVILLA